MSHKTELTLSINDPAVLQVVCERLGLPMAAKTVQFYDKQSITGTAIDLPGWRYPAVIDAQGLLHYDNYNGHWGNIQELDRLVHEYSVEATTQWALLQGYSASQQTDAEGNTVIEMLTWGGPDTTPGF